MEENKTVDKKLLYPFLIMLIGALMLVLTLLLPFASATGDYREGLEEYSDSVFSEELDMTNAEAKDISLVEYARIYAVTAEMGVSKGVSVAGLVIIIGFGIFAGMTLLFALLRKPIPAIIFNLLALAVFRITKWDFEDRGVVGNSSYDWGIGQYFCYIGGIVVIVGAVALLRSRKIAKQ